VQCELYVLGALEIPIEVQMGNVATDA
jgi:hypothetical protein